MKVHSLLFILVIGVLVGSASFAQTAPAGVPRMANGKPNFNGFWQKPDVPDMTVTSADPKLQTGTKDLPFTDWGKKEFQSYDAAKNNVDKTCLPLGHTRSMNLAEPMQFIQDGKYLAILYERNNWFQPVPLDGRKHREGEPRWFGDSVGHWEGDTVVIESVNFNDLTTLDLAGHPHSDQLKLVQKFSFVDPTHIHYQVIVTDPKAYSKSWTNDRTFTFGKGAELKEDSCEDRRASQ